MALYSCKKHGQTGAKMLCPHAARGLETGVPLKTTLIEIGDFSVPKAHLCDECVAIWKSLLDDVQKEHFMETLVPVCGKCFDESVGSL